MIWLVRFQMWLRSVRETLNGGKARRAAEWKAACEKAEREHLNRSDGARRGWAKRKAREALRLAGTPSDFLAAHDKLTDAGRSTGYAG